MKGTVLGLSPKEKGGNRGSLSKIFKMDIFNINIFIMDT